MPDSPNTFITTSWDDGHPLDLQLADALEKHAVPATFYIPRNDKLNGRPVVTEDQIRALSNRGFEIGAHTLDHTPLTTVDDREAQRQIVESRKWVEDVTGKPCHLFCPPCGWFHKQHVAMIADAGFDAFRTVELWSHDLPRNTASHGLQELPTSIHARTYGLPDTARNLAKRKALGNAWRFLRCGLTGNWTDHALRLLDRAEARNGCFHLWGHSWEFENDRDWKRLDRVLGALAQRIQSSNAGPQALTNHGLVQHQA
ncbi:MAG: polysaccharide deacetylase family protein [Algisphaera sp.]